MRDGASSFGLSISHMKLEINLNRSSKTASKKGNLNHSTKLKQSFMQIKPNFRMKLLS